MTPWQEIFLRDHAHLISPWKFTAGERQRLSFTLLAQQWRWYDAQWAAT